MHKTLFKTIKNSMYSFYLIDIITKFYSKDDGVCLRYIK